MTPIPVGPFEFYAPERLWALLAIPILLILYLIALKFSSKRGIRYTNTGLVDAVLPKQSQWRRHVAVLMTLASLTLIAGAWARPVGIDKVPRERATVILVLDISLSMQATDVAPNRLEASKEAAKEFVGALPEKFNVALVAMSGAPGVRVPPTQDRDLVYRTIDSLELRDGTAVGDSLNVALQAIAMAPGTGAEDEEPAPAMIVMLSDGQNTSGLDPTVPMQQAARDEVPVHTIAFGTENGYVDLDGSRYNVAPDRQLLKMISDSTGGMALDADSVHELDDVYQQIESAVGLEEVRKEITSRWAFYSLAFALVASLGAVSIAARWP